MPDISGNKDAIFNRLTHLEGRNTTRWRVNRTLPLKNSIQTNASYSRKYLRKYLEPGRSLTHLLNSWGCSAWCAASFRLSSQVHLEGWGVGVAVNLEVSRLLSSLGTSRGE